MTECPHGMDDPTWCADCRGLPDDRDDTVEVVTEAAFASTCPCGGRIEPGDQIGRIRDEWRCPKCVRRVA